VVPAFINGLSNKLWREVIANVRGRDPIVAVFGEPIDLSAFPAETRLAHHKRCSDLFCTRIAALMDEERRVRSGTITAASRARAPSGR
jgi:hypothetical protein